MPRLTDRLTVPIAPADRETLKAAAQAAGGVTVAEYVRSAVLAKAKSDRRLLVREKALPRRARVPGH